MEIEAMVQKNKIVKLWTVAMLLLIVTFSGIACTSRSESDLSCPMLTDEDRTLLLHYDMERRGDSCIAIAFHQKTSKSSDYYFVACIKPQVIGGFELPETVTLRENLINYRSINNVENDISDTGLQIQVCKEISNLYRVMSKNKKIMSLNGYPQEGMVKLFLRDPRNYFIIYDDSSLLSAETKSIIAKYKVSEPIGNCVEVLVKD